jgi:ribosome maturation factor RimP
MAALRDRLTGVIEPVAAHAGFDLERVAVSRVGRRHSVRVFIDRDEGVGLDAIAEVSRAVSEALDAADESGAAVIPGEYVLEISSPGVDRQLTAPRHWRRNLGRLVTVPAAGETLTGRILDTDDHAVMLEVDGARRQLPYDQLGPGRVQVELRHADYEGEDEAR